MLRLRPPRPYSLALTAERLVRFAEVVDRLDDGGVYRRLTWTGRSALLVAVRQLGPPSRAELAVELLGRDARSAPAQAAARDLLDRVLGTGTPVRPFYRALGGDSLLAGPIRRFRGLRVAGSADLWEALVTAVLSQQISLHVAYRIRRDLALAYGRRARFDGALYHTFPRPARIARERESDLRRFGLSRAKAGTVLRLAESTLAGELAHSRLAPLPDDEVVARLTSVKGVGRWTAEVALMRGLRRPDAFPAADLGVVKVLAQGMLGRRAPAAEDEMRRFSERWRPHRSLALAYAYADLARRAR